MKITVTIVKSTILFVLLSKVSLAAIVSVGGDISMVLTPASVEPGMLESSTNTRVFNERQSYTLSSDLSVDQLVATSSSGTVTAGTVVNSYFLHTDPVGDSELVPDLVNLSGTITFDTKIIALIWTGVPCDHCPATAMNLDASDYLGLASTSYPTGGLGRGYEIDDYYTDRGVNDFLSISADGYSLTTVSTATYPLYSDQLRILTAAVPIPSALWLLGSGLLCLLGVARRKNL